MDKKKETAAKLGKALGSLAGGLSKAAANLTEKAEELSEGKSLGVSEALSNVSAKATELTGKAKDSLVKAIDVSGDGEIGIDDVIIMGLRVPGVHINREAFLRSEFAKRCPQEVIDDAVARTPAQAGISADVVDAIADDVIRYERNCASGISAALGMPGGVAMAATIPADVAQYYGYMLRTAQKLMYLYGFPEIDAVQNGTTFDSETINILTICLGIMYGVAGACNAIKAMAKALANGVEKKLLNAALTKGAVYPIVKSVASWFGKKMTKQIFANFFKKAIPVAGGVVGGAITFASFKPCCDRLKESLRDTMLSNPDHQVTEEEESIVIEDTGEDEISDVHNDADGE